MAKSPTPKPHIRYILDANIRWIVCYNWWLLYMVLCMIDHIEIFTRYPLTIYMYVRKYLLWRIGYTSKVTYYFYPHSPFVIRQMFWKIWNSNPYQHIYHICVPVYCLTVFLKYIGQVPGIILQPSSFQTFRQIFYSYTIAGIIWVKYCWYGVNLSTINQSINWYNCAWFNLFFCSIAMHSGKR